MPTLTLDKAEQVAASWRGGIEQIEGWTSPAGPLFPSGEYAEADIAVALEMGVSICGTDCTYSCLRSSDIWLQCC